MGHPRAAHAPLHEAVGGGCCRCWRRCCRRRQRQRCLDAATPVGATTRLPCTPAACLPAIAAAVLAWIAAATANAEAVGAARTLVAGVRCGCGCCPRDAAASAGVGSRPCPFPGHTRGIDEMVSRGESCADHGDRARRYQRWCRARDHTSAHPPRLIVPLSLVRSPVGGAAVPAALHLQDAAARPPGLVSRAITAKIRRPQCRHHRSGSGSGLVLGSWAAPAAAAHVALRQRGRGIVERAVQTPPTTLPLRVCMGHNGMQQSRADADSQPSPVTHHTRAATKER